MYCPRIPDSLSKRFYTTLAVGRAPEVFYLLDVRTFLPSMGASSSKQLLRESRLLSQSSSGFQL
jgi:hypothetical protein